MKSIRHIGATAISVLLILIGMPSISSAANATPQVTITNINNHRGATISRDLIEVSLVINSPDTITDWSLQLLSTSQAFTSRSELAAFAAETKASGEILATKPGTAPLQAQTPVPTSITITGAKSAVRALGVHGFWLRVVTNGVVAKSIPFFSYGGGDSNVKPTPITWMLPLVEPPHRDLRGNFNDDDLAKTLSPDGRLGRILNFGSGPLVTWLIDPELVESVEAMSHGYTFGAGKPGAGKDIAAAWLAQLKSAVAGSQVVALPYGDPDLVTFAHAGLKKELTRTINEGTARLSALLGQPITKIAAWPTDGLLNKPTQSLIETSAATTLLLSSNSIVSSGTSTGSSVLNAGATNTQLVYDATLSKQFNDLTPLSSNRAAAELTMITAERPAIARAQLILPPRLWNPNNESMAGISSGAPVREFSLPKLESAPSTQESAIRLSKISPLNESNVDTLKVIRKNLATFANVNPVASKTIQSEILRSTLVLATSWRGRSFNAALYARRAQTSSAGIVRQVRVLSGRYTLTSLHQKLPITIANDSPDPATVTLSLIPSTYRVLQPARVKLTLEPDSKTQVMIPIEAITSGDLTIFASVFTPKGEILGDVTALSLSVRTVPAIANWIMEGAGVALLLGAGAQVIRRVRRRNDIGDESEHQTADNG